MLPLGALRAKRRSDYIPSLREGESKLKGQAICTENNWSQCPTNIRPQGFLELKPELRKMRPRAWV